MRNNNQETLMGHSLLRSITGNITPVKYGITAFALVLLSGCVSSPAFDTSQSTRPTGDIYSSIPQDKLTTSTRKITAEGIKALDENDFDKASELFNLAVKTDITNSYLQFLNALAYHMRGLQGESSNMALAETGYELAIQFDSSNWLAQYYLGLLYLDQRKYTEAKVQLGKAALYMEDDPDLLYNLALAAYYSQDLKTADAALRGARKHLTPANKANIMRASAIVSAALNDADNASQFLGVYRDEVGNSGQARYVEHRVNNWQRINDNLSASPATFQRTQLRVDDDTMNTMPSDDAMNQMPVASSFAEDESFVDKKMAVIDVTIIGTQEDINTSMGVNLLQGLQLQFGNIDDGTVGFSKSRNNVKDTDNPANNTSIRSLTRFISIPAVTYSLNIANSNTERNEVLARPSLVALSGETSEFFSGRDITGAAVSGGDGDSVSIEKQVGVKLAVTPEFLPNDLVKLSIQAERTFLINPSANVVFDFRLDTTKTIVNANVVMRFGETLILSGLSEKAGFKNRDGVPLLQDIPVIQYAFSRKTTRDYNRSVLILVTPRRAQYTDQTAEAQQQDRATLSDSERDMAEFEDKYRDWFKPLPSTAAIFAHLGNQSVYREFRTGDLTMQQWNNQQSHGDRMKAAADFIYY
jgi:general secretion pathway protein D